MHLDHRSWWKSFEVLINWSWNWSWKTVVYQWKRNNRKFDQETTTTTLWYLSDQFQVFISVCIQRFSDNAITSQTQVYMKPKAHLVNQNSLACPQPVRFELMFYCSIRVIRHSLFNWCFHYIALILFSGIFWLNIFSLQEGNFSLFHFYRRWIAPKQLPGSCAVSWTIFPQWWSLRILFNLRG